MSIRDEIDSAVGAVLFNASNYPKSAMPHMLGQDIGPLREKVVEAVLAAVQPTPSAEPCGSLDAKLDALGLRDPDEPARPDALPFPHAKADKLIDAAPPSIANMVPGTTVDRDSLMADLLRRGDKNGHLTIRDVERAFGAAPSIDPSTIRDVTPPK